MKKAGIPLLTVLAIFLCVLVGILIGRHTASGNVYISNQVAVNEQIGSDVINLNPTEDFGKININTASVSQLESLPNIGETLALRIIDYRTENGDYTVIEDLLQVKGIGETRLDEIRQFITTGG